MGGGGCSSFELRLSDSLNPRMPLPTALPASGRRLGPRTTRAITSTTMSSMGPTFGMQRLRGGARPDHTACAPTSHPEVGVPRQRPTQPGRSSAAMAEAPKAVRELAGGRDVAQAVPAPGGRYGRVAASLAAFIAACGSDSKSMSSSPPAATAAPMASSKSGTEQFGAGDLGIANYALTLEYLEADFYAKVANSGMLKGKLLHPALEVRQRGAGARRRADRADQEGGRQAGHGAEDELPARQREVDPEARGDGREPRRPRLPRPGSATSRTRRSWPPPSRSTRSRPAMPRPQPRHGRQAGDRRLRLPGPRPTRS